MLLFRSALINYGRVVRLGRWKDGEVEKVGKVGGWWSGKGERFLVLLKGGGCRVSQKFHIFVFDVNQGNKETRWNCHWNCMYPFGGIVVGKFKCGKMG